MTQEEKIREDKRKTRKTFIIVGIVIAIITIIFTIMDSQNPVKLFFRDNKLGNPKLIEEKETSDGKVTIFKNNNVQYKVYFIGDEISEIYLGLKYSYLIYDKANNDTDINDTERAIISNAEKFLKEINKKGKIEFLNDDIKSQIDFSDTFEHIETSYEDLGTRLL